VDFLAAIQGRFLCQRPRWSEGEPQGLLRGTIHGILQCRGCPEGQMSRLFSHGVNIHPFEKKVKKDEKKYLHEV
jgi:hypothetical protein